MVATVICTQASALIAVKDREDAEKAANAKWPGHPGRDPEPYPGLGANSDVPVDTSLSYSHNPKLRPNGQCILLHPAGD